MMMYLNAIFVCKHFSHCVTFSPYTWTFWRNKTRTDSCRWQDLSTQTTHKQMFLRMFCSGWSIPLVLSKSDFLTVSVKKKKRSGFHSSFLVGSSSLIWRENKNWVKYLEMLDFQSQRCLQGHLCFWARINQKKNIYMLF